MSTKQARRYDRGLWILEVLAFRELRKRLLSEVSGNILEIGIGTGVNLPLYRGPGSVTGIDPRPEMLSGAAARDSIPPFYACCAQASRLPFAAGYFDNVVSTLVFCSVPDVREALLEISRVLKPGGRLLMMEHVRGRTPVSRRITDWLHPAWFAIQKECHLNRDTETSLKKAGYRIESSSTHGRGMLQLLEASPPAEPGEA